MNSLHEIQDKLINNEIESAFELIIKCEKTHINNPEYWNIRGVLCLKVNEYKTAIGCFKKSLEINQYNSDVYYNYAYALEQEGNLSDSALYFGLAYRYTDNQEVRKELESFFINNKALMDIFNVAAQGKQKNYVILSSCGWGNVYQRMHHIARSLVKYGHNVTYICPGVQIKVDNQKIIPKDLTKISIRNMINIDGVNILSPISASFSNQLVAENYTHLVQTVLDINSENHSGNVILTYLPYQVNVLNSLKGEYLHIYDCVDDHTDLEYAFWGNKRDVIWEKELLEKADAITTTATSLYLQRVAIEKRKNVFMSRNAVNEGDFIANEYIEMPNDLVNIPEPRIVFTGVVYNRFDEELFYSVVESNPDKSFVIIGPIHNGLLTRKFHNLFLLGEKKHSELKDYLSFMQIGIVPYIESAEMDISCDSIKQYEYIASGLPVITTFMPDSAINKINTFLAKSKEMFNESIDKCLKLYIDKNHIKEFTVQNSWNLRAALLSKIANNDIIVESTKDNLIEVGKELNKLVKRYDSVIFDTLKGMYSNIENSMKFEKILEDAYFKENLKFVEKQYMTALLINEKYHLFLQVVINSSHIKEEIKKELQYRIKKKDLDPFKTLALICIKDLKEFISQTQSLKNINDIILYNLYIRHIFGEEINKQELLHLNQERDSPLYRYLLEQKSDIKKNGYTILVEFFNDRPSNFIETIKLNNINIDYYCTQNLNIDSDYENISISKIVNLQKDNKIKLLIPYDKNYVKQVRLLAEKGIKECFIVLVEKESVKLVHIDDILMKRIAKKDYLKNITFNKYNAADSNVHAVLKYIPREYRKKYKFNIIYGTDVWSVENIVKVPLISSVTVSGFATFLYNYPHLTYNIELGHSGVPLKACGSMDKKDKNSGGNPIIFNKVDRVCVASNLHKMLFSSFYGIPENKYAITGLPRNDLLTLSSSKINLENLLGINLNGKKVIFNMPTFHVFEQTNRVEGSNQLTDSIKIPNVNYQEFDEFLYKNNLVCVSKVHHGEEKTVTANTKNRNFNNIFFLTNNDLERNNLDLYEILGAGDLLLTDYSSIYNDFLYIGKPVIFINYDIEEYRKERGLALEPYDYWTAGPKVQTIKQLQEEILNCLSDPNYFKLERENLFPLFFDHCDSNAIQRIWEMIDETFSKISL